MKRILIVILSICFAFAFAGCGSGDSTDDSSLQDGNPVEDNYDWLDGLEK